MGDEGLLEEDREHPTLQGLYLHGLAIAAVCCGPEKLMEPQAAGYWDDVLWNF